MRFVSSYTGAGGMDLGFIQAGFTPVWANDIDRWAVATYKEMLENLGLSHSHATVGDIRGQDLPAAGCADLVIGGPPCQGFSVAGRMNPQDPRSRHVWDFLGLVKRVKPTAFVMENVKALAVNKRWSGLIESLMAEATDMGYQVSLHVLNAAHFEVPQARERMFLIGIPEGLPEPQMIPVTSENPPTVRQALEALPPLGDIGNNSLCAAKVTLAKNPVLRRSPYAGMLFNGQGRPLNLDGPAITLPATMGGNRTPIIDQLQLDHGGEHWIIGYHKRLWDERKKALRKVPARLRRLSVQEAAALQTFPQWVDWQGPQSAQYRQVGNAVPPTLAFHVARAVKASIYSANETEGTRMQSDYLAFT